MSQVKIVVEEKLGGQVSFGGKEIRVLKSTYDAVPEDKRSEFESVLIKAQELYHSKVDAVKKLGKRPQPSKLKSEAINEVIVPYMESNSLSKGTVKRGESRVVKPTVTKESSKVKEVKSPTDKESLQKEFDNFPADLLDDSSESNSHVSETKSDFADLEEELGMDDVLGEGEEEVLGASQKDPFESSESDPFDNLDGDPFGDIDLDI